MRLKGKNVRVRGRFWHYLFELHGKMHSGNTGLAGIESNRTAAEEYAERKRGELLKPQMVADNRGPKTFDVAAGEFTAWARDVEYRTKPNTSARLWTSMQSCIEFFGDRPVEEIGAGMLEMYKEFRLQQHKVREITLRHDLHALSVFFQYGKKMGWVERNPVEDVKIPSDRDAVREHVVSPEEEGVYFATAMKLHAGHLKSHPDALPNLHDVARLMLEQGARPEEILAARKEVFDHAAGTLRIEGGKTRAARRLLDLTAKSVAILETRAQTPGPWLFPSDRRPGQHITKLQATHDRVCLEAGVCFVLYDLRHTWATRMIAAGNDVPTVASIMGHSGLRTIYRYVHPTAGAKKLAMERYEAAATRRELKVVNK
jgi:integrase